MSEINSEPIQKINSLRNRLLIFLLSGIVVYLILFTFKILTDPYPLEYRESAALIQTGILLQGNPPYSVQSYPAGTNLYGILYSVVVYPFAVIGGNTFFVHRLVSVIFILLLGLCVFLVYRKNKKSYLASAAASVTLYSILIDSGAKMARPDSLGMLLFLLPLVLIYLNQSSKRSFYWSLIFPALAWTAKPYFILSAATVYLYAWLNKSFSFAVRLAAIAGVLLAATVFFLNACYDFYLNDTFFANLALAGHSVQFLTYQTKTFLLLNFFLVTLLIIGVAIYLIPAKGQISKLKELALNQGATVFLIQLIISLLVFIKMGQHDGSLEYSIHLIIPILIFLVGFLKMDNSLPKIFLVFIFLQLNCAIPRIPHNSPGPWLTLQQTLASHPGPVLHAPPTVFLAGPNEAIYDSGQTEYFAKGILNINPRKKLVEDLRDQFQKDLNSKLENKYFSVVLIPKIGSGVVNVEILKKTYAIQSNIVLPMNTNQWEIEIWLPK